MFLKINKIRTKGNLEHVFLIPVPDLITIMHQIRHR